MIFILTWLYWICAALIDLIVIMIPILRFYCKRGDSFNEDFSTEELSIKGTFVDKIDGDRKHTFISYDKDRSSSSFQIKSMMELYYRILKRDTLLPRRGKKIDINILKGNKLIKKDQKNQSWTLDKIEGKNNETDL